MVTKKPSPIWSDVKAKLVRIFEQALAMAMALPEAAQREPFLDRLEDIRAWGQGMGWGLDENFNASWLKAGLEIDA